MEEEERETHAKEIIYDEQISPLMQKIIEICKEHDIGMFAEVEISDSLSEGCTSNINMNKSMRMDMLYILSRCGEDNSVNIDKFFMNIAKKYDNGQSIYMRRAFPEKHVTQ